MYLVQVWIFPPLQMGAPIKLSTSPEIRLRNVEISCADDVSRRMTLLETDGTQGRIRGDPRPDMRRLGKVISAISFGLLTRFEVVCARLLPTDRTDDMVEFEYYPGSPPGIALFDVRLGYQRKGQLSIEFLSSCFTDDLERAMNWFLRGMSSHDPVHRVVCHWAGLEALAPAVTGTWRCNRCDHQMLHCPECNESTDSPRATVAIRNFLEGMLGVPRHEFKRLYELRNKLLHGRMTPDDAGAIEASQASNRIQELLLHAIKHGLHTPIDCLPQVSSEGLTIHGNPSCSMSMAAADIDHDRPPVAPTVPWIGFIQTTTSAPNQNP